MPSEGEMTVDILMFTFVGCGFICVVGCTSALLKKCYDKYAIQRNTSFRDLPYEPELSMETFQNLEGRYAKAAVSVIIPFSTPVGRQSGNTPHPHNGQDQEIDLVEVCVYGSETEELVETNIIAEEVIV